MISPLIKWNHKENYQVLRFDEKIETERILDVSLQDAEFTFIMGHEIDREFIQKYQALNLIFYLFKVASFSQQLDTFYSSGRLSHSNIDVSLKTLMLNLRI